MTLQQAQSAYDEAMRQLTQDQSFTAACAAQQAAINLQDAERRATQRRGGV